MRMKMYSYVRSLCLITSIVLFSGCKFFEYFEDDPISEPAPERKKVRVKKPSQASGKQDLEGHTVKRFADGHYLLAISKKEAWNSLLDSLSRNYVLTVVDYKSGVLTTDWDRFYLGNRVLRNRLTIRLKEVSKASTELFAFNNYEQLKGDKWVAATDEGKEVERVVTNLAHKHKLIYEQAPRH